LKQLGYSYRRPFAEFCRQFRLLDTTGDSSGTDKERAIRLIESSGLPREDWAIGKTMLFMKPDSLKLLANSKRELLAAWIPTVNLIEACWLRHKYRNELIALMPTEIRIQAHFRWHCYKDL